MEIGYAGHLNIDMYVNLVVINLSINVLIDCEKIHVTYKLQFRKF